MTRAQVFSPLSNVVSLKGEYIYTEERERVRKSLYILARRTSLFKENLMCHEKRSQRTLTLCDFNCAPLELDCIQRVVISKKKYSSVKFPKPVQRKNYIYRGEYQFFIILYTDIRVRKSLFQTKTNFCLLYTFAAYLQEP